MKITQLQQKKVITELSAMETQLDSVLFARNDDEDENGHPWLAGGAAGAGLTAAGYGLNRKGARLNAIPRPGPTLGPPAPGGILKNIGTGAKATGESVGETLSSVWKRLLRVGSKAV